MKLSLFRRPSYTLIQSAIKSYLCYFSLLTISFSTHWIYFFLVICGEKINIFICTCGKTEIIALLTSYNLKQQDSDMAENRVQFFNFQFTFPTKHNSTRKKNLIWIKHFSLNWNKFFFPASTGYSVNWKERLCAETVSY